MEAPEKIYLIRNFPNSTALNTTNDHHGKFLDEWYMSREKDADVEYICTDVFIERACKWIKDNYLKYPSEDCADTTKFVTDFKTYMKGK